MNHIMFYLAGTLLIASAVSTFAADSIWVKGNLHTHTNNSDGDAPPQQVADWYQNNGYHFLVISDHNKLTPTADLKTNGMIFVNGDEIDVMGAPRPLHVNALGIDAPIPQPSYAVTPAHSLAALVETIRETGGIPMVNHPNFGWAFGHRELLQVKDPYLLEVFNGHPLVNNAGNMAYLQVEQTWDILLSEGKTIYATATDDAHNYQAFAHHLANPGRGWVYVRVPELTPTAILTSLRAGDFYASTGVELQDYRFSDGELSVRVKPEEGKSYTIRFVGKWGRILHEVTGTSASYRFTEKPEADSYIRCKVIADDGRVAWTQAHRL